ncbi:unnamed protein product, partial [Discosporangium mesarthrocarpum]
GSAELHKSVPRGGFVSVGGQDFRVCLDGTTAYDEDTLTLCSPTDPYTPIHFEGAATKYDNTLTQAPAYVLDTAIGSAYRLAIGDTALKTWNGPDSNVSVNDLTGVLARGDFFRLGHPDEGQVFSVCEEDDSDGVSTFNSTSLPLCSADDPSERVSVLEGHIVSATYEIQTFGVWVNTSGSTNPANATDGLGFRLVYGDHTTAWTEAGGDPGCLAFGATEHEVAREIEALPEVDEVSVSRTNLTNFSAEYQEYMYTVTFVGEAVAGDVPQLEVADVGANGCGTGNATIGDVEGSTLQNAFIPLYKVQTTEDLAFNAAAADVKAAVESLTGACKVDVERSIRGNGFEWLVTFSEGHNGQLLRTMRPNAVLLSNVADYVEPNAHVVPILRVDLATPRAGVPYYARVAAVNEVGTGTFRFSTPISLQPSPQEPGPPRYAVVNPVSDTELLVQWESPLSDGGEGISEYVIEWDVVDTFDSGTDGYPQGSAVVTAAERSSVVDVQAVRLSVDDGLYISGTFTLMYDGQTTGDINFDATAREVEDALESMCTVGDVSVTRTLGPAEGGFTWLITFLAPAAGAESGTGQVSTMSALQTVTSHRLSVDGNHVLACKGPARTVCWNDPDRTSVGIETRGEVQRLLCSSSGNFTLSFMGVTTSSLSASSSAAEIEDALEATRTTGDVTVSGACNATTDSYIYVTFENMAGDLVPIYSSEHGDFEQVIRGQVQVVVGRKPYSYTISDVSDSEYWYVRIFAYNHVGYSSFSMARHDSSEYVLPAVGAPDIPKNISTMTASARSAWVYWDAPSTDGGDSVTDYLVQWDTVDGFDSSCGDGPEIQTLSVSSPNSTHYGKTFNVTIGGVLGAHCLDWNSTAAEMQAALRASDSSLGNIVVSRGGDGSSVWGYGYQYSITFGTDYDVSDCQAMNLQPAGAGLVASGYALGAGDDPLGSFGYLATNLKPGVKYRVRIAAVNSYARSPWAYSGYPGTPSHFEPGAVPHVPRNVTLAPGVSPGTLHLGIGLPYDINVDGVGGRRLDGFRLELAKREYEVQALIMVLDADSTSTSPVLPDSGSYMLSVGNASTWCLDWDASAEDIQLALDALTTVDGVSVSTGELKSGDSSDNSSFVYEVLVHFTGPHLSNGDQELMDFAYCTSFGAGAYLDIYTVTDGIPGVVSPVVKLSTASNGTSSVNGRYSISFGHRGDLTLRLGEGNSSSVYVRVDAGSRVV